VRYMGWVLCGLLAACASTRPSQEEPGAPVVGLKDLEQECDETRVLALCDSTQCELFWCRAVAPSLAAGQPPQSLRGGGMPLPGLIGLNVGTVAPSTRSETFFARRILKASAARLEAPSPEGFRVFNGRDVIQQLVSLQKPGDVAAWWASEPKVHPDQWLHALSSWEREYPCMNEKQRWAAR
jgi:hypothetical protein